MPPHIFTDGDDRYILDTPGEHVLAFLAGNDTLDIRGGTFTTALMGDDDDRMILRAGDASVFGESGDDRFDVLGSGFEGHGGGGDDRFNFYAGNNHRFSGDAGNDSFYFDTSSTGVALMGGSGNDLFSGYHRTVGGSLYGEEGNDSFVHFRAAGTALTLYGGAGNDTYTVHATSPATIVESAGEGSDLIYVARGDSYTLGANLENLRVRGMSGSVTGSATLNGNALNNVITGHLNDETIDGGDGNDIVRGSGGNDMLAGGAGNDQLDGGSGMDTMAGGTGNDTYFVDAAEDLVDELPGGGADTTRASITYTLTANVEMGVLTGASSINLTGNGLANRLTGNSADNILTGLAGNDVLVGGLGADTMIGGDGDDIYYFDSYEDEQFQLREDIILEGVDDGIDLVITSDNISALFDNVENATGVGDGIVLHGNGLHNILTGTGSRDSLLGFSGDDTLNGGGGDDNLSGHDGNDRIVGGAGADLMLGGNDQDVLQGGAGGDRLNGDSGNDLIDGGSGADDLTGGAGNDIFEFAAASDSAPAAFDIVHDFENDFDQIDLSAIDANTSLSGNQAFSIVSAPSGTAGELWSTSVMDANSDIDITFYGDVDGDGLADFQVLVHGNSHLFYLHDVTL